MVEFGRWATGLTKVSAARLVAVKKFKFFSTPIWAMSVFERKMRVPTMGVDKYWRLYFDPRFTDSLPIDHLVGILLHEVIHLTRKHPSRRDLINAEMPIANYAMDIEVNQIVKDMKASLPDDGVFLEKFPGLEPDQPWEIYYRALMEDAPPKGKDSEEGEGDEDGEGGAGYGGSCDDGEVREWEDGDPSGPNGDGKDADGNDIPEGLSEGRANTIIRKTAEDVKAAAGRGEVPNSMGVWAGEITDPKVDWRRELHAAVTSAVTFARGRDLRTYRRPNRRQAAYGGDVIFKGRHSPVPRVIIGWDTSGSMMSLMADAASEVQGIVSAMGVGEVTILPCDAKCGTPITVAAGEPITNVADAITGGGGTNMGEVITKSIELGCDVCIVLTDCMTPWECEEPTFKTLVGAVGANEDTLERWPIPEWATLLMIGDEANE